MQAQTQAETIPMKHNWHSAQLAASSLFVLAIQRQLCQASIWEVPISLFARAFQ